MPRRFPPPWSIEERQESFIVKDVNGGRPMLWVGPMQRPSRDDGRMTKMLKIWASEN
jgi:hypothetical protein